MQGFSSVIEAAIRYSFRISAPVDSEQRLQVSIDRHRKVLDAIEAQDPAAASSAMTQVMRESIENAHYEFAAKPLVVTMPLNVG
jgi:DNA-binding GntR family transcriptional regulator